MKECKTIKNINIIVEIDGEENRAEISGWKGMKMTKEEICFQVINTVISMFSGPDATCQTELSMEIEERLHKQIWSFD